MSLTPRGMSVQEAYRLYAENKLTVNRRYQRKLVWSEQEKRYLIDSIEKELPIPLFMFARNDTAGNTYEIIDDMQRLNAIFSFIEHQFVDEIGKCFDLEQFSRAKLSRDAGVFDEFPSTVDRLSAGECARFLEYQLAVTIDSEGDEARINEVFGRINSSGRRLSPQEQRQAGLVSDFSEFVRRLSMELRGDSSPDTLLLNQMPEVSFNTPREKQRYGIDARDVFWCRHGIISPQDLAKGEDEQVITDISISLLILEPLNASREVFDTYFDPASDQFRKINVSLSAYGSEKLKNEIITTISTIRSVFEQRSFVSFRNCVHESPRNTARTAFFAVFMAFFDLMFKRGMFPDDFDRIVSSLNDTQKLMIRSAHHTTSDDRKKNVSVITGLIQGCFINRDVSSLGTSHALVVDLENSIRRAKYEASRYEFKLGICELNDSPRIDPKIFSKIGRTACAIANTNPNMDGYIYIGIADKKSASDRIETIYGIAAIQIGDFYFTGVKHDLIVTQLDLESYVKKIIFELQNLPISNPLKTQIVTSIDHAEYQGRPFVRMRIPAQQELSEYDGTLPVRKNSETVDMTPSEAVAQARAFG